MHGQLGVVIEKCDSFDWRQKFLGVFVPWLCAIRALARPMGNFHSVWRNLAQRTEKYWLGLWMEQEEHTGLRGEV